MFRADSVAVVVAQLFVKQATPMRRALLGVALKVTAIMANPKRLIAVFPMHGPEHRRERALCCFGVARRKRSRIFR